MEHEWYGNIRELRAVLESACIMAYDRDVIDIQHISDEFLTFEEIYTDTTEFEPKLSEDKMFSEKERIKEALRKSSGNRKKAAEMLGISVTTLWRKMKKYNLVGEIS